MKELIPLKILVIEDELIDQKAIKRAINKSGIVAETTIVDNAKAGFDAIKNTHFDCIFIDYLLPDTNGIEVVEKLTLLEVKSPLIIVTSQTDDNLAQKAIAAGATNYLTKSLISPDGVSLIVRNSISINTIQSELTAARQVADKSAQIKQDFLANMSHEIRTPMNAIIGYARLLLDSKLTKKQVNYLQTIYSSSENLLMIINDILDFSKIESGKLNIEKITFNLKHTVNNVVKVLSNTAAIKNITLEVDYPKNGGEYFIGDPYRINQILLNLVNNGIKFTQEGGVKIKIEILKSGIAKNVVVLKVIDSGIGIPADAKDGLFESFVQAESSTSRRFGGTGLGLSIVKQLVSLMNGEVAVDSVENEGSTFSIYLELEKGERLKKDKSRSNSVEKEMQEHDFSANRILLVDDNEVNRNLAKIHFKKIGCKVDFAEDGIIASEMGIKGIYDIIFMDIQMPRMDGIEASKLILMEIPTQTIVGMSAHVLQTEIDHCFSIGMKDYLKKPYTQKELFELCSKYFYASEKPKNKSRKPPTIKEVTNKLTVAGELDLTFFKNEVGDEPELIRDVLKSYMHNYVNFKISMEEYLANENREGIASLMHKIGPGVSMLGQDELQQQIKNIELTALEAEPFSVLKNSVSVTSEELEKFAGDIEQYLNSN